MDAADRALDAAWPARQGQAFVKAMQSAEVELGRIGDAMAAAGTPAVERSRVHRYRGSILSDLAPALGTEMLVAARDAYLQAEALLEGHGDPQERAKLDFNFGNTLRQLDPNDLDQLREAERRFLAARAVFERSAPQYLPRIDEALSSTRSLMAIAPVAQSVQRARDDMEILERRITDGADPEQVSAAFAELMKRGGGPAALLGKIQGVINTLSESARADPRYGKVLEQFEKAATLAAGTSRGADPEAETIMDMLRKRLAEEEQSGRVSGNRADSLLAALERFSSSVRPGGEELPDLMKKVAGMRSAAEAMFEANHYLSHGLPRPPEGSRAAALVELSWRLRLALLREGVERDKSQRESEAVLDLSLRASRLDRRIYEAGADAARALAVEREGLRPMAIEVRQFAARHHPQLVNPRWPVTRVPLDPNAVLFSGSANTRRKVAAACKKLGFDLLSPLRGHDAATACWWQLQEAGICVFDLTADEGPPRAAVAYELGIARTLGRSVVVLVGRDERVPFDVDIEPTRLQGDGRDAATIRGAIDEAAVWLMPRPRSDTIASTVTDVLRRFPDAGGNTYVDQTLKQLRRLRDEAGPLDTRADPLAIGDALRTLVTYLDDPAPMLIFPPWAPCYRSQEAKRLFHVMPFRPAWADEAADRVQGACESLQVEYIRGDRVANPDVIPSIWEEINLASHVLVDLTGFNPNVALELGIADTLGRPTLVVGQGDTVEQLFPAIARLRFHPYPDASSVELQARVQAFLAPS